MHCCCNWADCHEFQLELTAAYNALGVPTEERPLVGNLIQVRVESSDFASAARPESISYTKKKLLVRRFVKHIGMDKERLQVFSAGRSVDSSCSSPWSAGKTVSFFVARHHFHESLLTGRITTLISAEEAKKANIYYASDVFPTRRGKQKMFLRVPNVTRNQLRETIKSLKSKRSARRQFRRQDKKTATIVPVTAAGGQENMVNNRLGGAVCCATGAAGTTSPFGIQKPPQSPSNSSSSMLLVCSFIYHGTTPMMQTKAPLPLQQKSFSSSPLCCSFTYNGTAAPRTMQIKPPGRSDVALLKLPLATPKQSSTNSRVLSKCQGLQSDRVDEYSHAAGDTTSHMGELLLHFSFFGGVWRSNNCSFVAENGIDDEESPSLQKQRCLCCSHAAKRIRDTKYPFLFKADKKRKSDSTPSPSGRCKRQKADSNYPFENLSPNSQLKR